MASPAFTSSTLSTMLLQISRVSAVPSVCVVMPSPHPRLSRCSGTSRLFRGPLPGTGFRRSSFPSSKR
ncbi:hypothetical protein ATCV1_z261L [Acanthocystis turfacea chlorella virus 1]|uniref:Uncharacterized protein z261L n=1 Tax=Chlorovirus heliozoae TaxID=322019 RepID=A7K8M1_9PHYC|nr:hypothetical protein ATCV1_z261L [Acanthocystis turfacea chlorella virus 1]ABT16395.1 hypothetical protein ATCV1_z261L [Acanthocystis turfacea chlorella virus 1]